MGLSPMNCALVGIQISILVSHCSYIREKYGNTQFLVSIGFSLFMIILVIGIDTGALLNLYGFIFGFLLGIGFYPKLP